MIGSAPARGRGCSRRRWSRTRARRPPSADAGSRGGRHTVSRTGRARGDVEEHTRRSRRSRSRCGSGPRSCARPRATASAGRGDRRARAVGALERLMTVDWEGPLVPPARALSRSCTCARDACEHVAALAFAIASEIDRDPGLLRSARCRCSRGGRAGAGGRCNGDRPGGGVESAGTLPEPRPLAAPARRSGVEASRPERAAYRPGRSRRRARARLHRVR